MALERRHLVDRVLVVAVRELAKHFLRDLQMEGADPRERAVALRGNPGQVILALPAHRPVIARESRAPLEERRLTVDDWRVLHAGYSCCLHVSGDEPSVRHVGLKGE